MFVLTAQQMRALEAQEMAFGRQSGLALMERAGQAVTDAIWAQWPELTKGAHRALVLCGPGNNGGDGFVVARLLAEQGWKTDVYHFGDAEKLPPDAAENYARFIKSNAVHPWSVKGISEILPPDILVDAVFGIGLTRPLPRDVSEVLYGQSLPAWVRDGSVRRIAIDGPSGLNLDTGHVPGAENGQDLAFFSRADLTVTFHAAKPGHYLSAGPALCGVLVIADIGLTDAPQDQTGRVRVVSSCASDGNSPRWPLNLIAKSRYSGHKYDHGHVVVFSGGPGHGGAARLAARAALRAGAGLVTALCPPDALAENTAALDAVMVRQLPAGSELTSVVDKRVTALCLGPGMGTTVETRERVLAALGLGEARELVPAVVLDADALSVFEDSPEALFAHTHDRAILTPHGGEFGRLFPDLAADWRSGASKIDVVRTAAARAGCVVLLKGPDTVIASPDGAASLHAAAYDRAAPWLATAGAGDVLAGLIAGLAAPGTTADLHPIAEAAVWLHVEAARAFGPGLIAEDLPEMLPGVFRALEP